MRKVLLGAVLMLAILLLAALAITRLGLMPVSADGPHSNLEARIMPEFREFPNPGIDQVS